MPETIMMMLKSLYEWRASISVRRISMLRRPSSMWSSWYCSMAARRGRRAAPPPPGGALSSVPPFTLS
eukprot:scaffold266415_cov32-Tisochrysis_lutea.AAC.3